MSAPHDYSQFRRVKARDYSPLPCCECKRQTTSRKAFGEDFVVPLCMICGEVRWTYCWNCKEWCQPPKDTKSAKQNETETEWRECDGCKWHNCNACMEPCDKKCGRYRCRSCKSLERRVCVCQYTAIELANGDDRKPSPYTRHDARH